MYMESINHHFETYSLLIYWSMHIQGHLWQMRKNINTLCISAPRNNIKCKHIFMLPKKTSIYTANLLSCSHDGHVWKTILAGGCHLAWLVTYHPAEINVWGSIRRVYLWDLRGTDTTGLSPGVEGGRRPCDGKWINMFKHVSWKKCAC